MSEPLLHLTVPAEWRAALAGGAVAPPSLREQGFVHLSTAAQVELPASRLRHGRHDVMLLVLDPDRLGVSVRWEPGVPSDPGSMRFPHAYGPVPTSAVLGVLPYRPRPDGGFDAPVLPSLDAAGRCALAVPSLLRRVATAEVAVTGGVAVLTSSVPGSQHHNQLVIDSPVDAAELVADADRVLGGAGLTHRAAWLTGDHLAPTATALAARGWTVVELLGLVARTGGAPDDGVARTGGAPDDGLSRTDGGTGQVRQVDLEAARPFWDATWLRALPGVDAGTVAQLTDRYLVEQEAIDLRCLAVVVDGAVVASCLLKIDGATAVVDAVDTAPGHRRRGHGNALLAEALTLAGTAGCDLVALEAAASDWPRGWYARHGFTEVTRGWSATRRMV